LSEVLNPIGSRTHSARRIRLIDPEVAVIWGLL
jgi:hypothetical protein